MLCLLSLLRAGPTSFDPVFVYNSCATGGVPYRPPICINQLNISSRHQPKPNLHQLLHIATPQPSRYRLAPDTVTFTSPTLEIPQPTVPSYIEPQTSYIVHVNRIPHLILIPYRFYLYSTRNLYLNDVFSIFLPFSLSLYLLLTRYRYR